MTEIIEIRIGQSAKLETWARDSGRSDIGVGEPRCPVPSATGGRVSLEEPEQDTSHRRSGSMTPVCASVSELLLKVWASAAGAMARDLRHPRKRGVARLLRQGEIIVSPDYRTPIDNRGSKAPVSAGAVARGGSPCRHQLTRPAAGANQQGERPLSRHP